MYCHRKANTKPLETMTITNQRKKNNDHLHIIEPTASLFSQIEHCLPQITTNEKSVRAVGRTTAEGTTRLMHLTSCRIENNAPIETLLSGAL